MKKTAFSKLNRIVLVALLGLMILQTSCKKEEEEKEILENLDGTVWKYTRYLNEDILYDYTLKFSESTFTWTVIDYFYSETNTSEGTYVYNYPNIKLVYSDGSYDDVIISGNQITIYEGMVFTKQ